MLPVSQAAARSQRGSPPAPALLACPPRPPPGCAGVVSYLESEFATLQRSKDATIRTLEPRVRNMRCAVGQGGTRVWQTGARRADPSCTLAASHCPGRPSAP